MRPPYSVSFMCRDMPSPNSIDHELKLKYFSEKAMTYMSTLTKLYESSPRIWFDSNSRFVFMSDNHRGDGSATDDYLKNQNTAYYALNHYYANGYTYIELGDGDELWENRKFSNILSVHSNIFELFKRFHEKGRLFLLYGNHDMVKRRKGWSVNHLRTYVRQNAKIALFDDKIPIYESLVLKDKATQREIFLIHGHQVDFLNYDIWLISRFLVRYFWRPLQMIGFIDPTSPRNSSGRCGVVGERLWQWAKKNGVMLIAGHTHQPVYPKVGNALYFNDGCCVHPRCITAIEINEGEITLVKWSVKTRVDGTLHVARSVLQGPQNINYLYEMQNNAN